MISLLHLLFAARRGALTRITQRARASRYKVHQRKSLNSLLNSVKNSGAALLFEILKNERFSFFFDTSRGTKFDKKKKKGVAECLSNFTRRGIYYILNFLKIEISSSLCRDLEILYN